MVRAEELSIALDSSLGERHSSMRTGVFEHTPLLSVVPKNDIIAQKHHCVRLLLVSELLYGQRIPLLLPVKLLRGRLPSIRIVFMLIVE